MFSADDSSILLARKAFVWILDHIRAIPLAPADMVNEHNKGQVL
jgi:hypothetical protein